MMFLYGFLTAIVVVIISLTIIGRRMVNKKSKILKEQTLEAYNKKKGEFVKKNKVARKIKKKVSEKSEV